MYYRQKYLKFTISLISTLVSTLLTISIPFNSVKADITNEKLQQSVVLQNNPQAALEVSQQWRKRELVQSLAQRSPRSLVQVLSIEQIQAVAKQQNATLVQYSIINDKFKIAGRQQTKESELYIWVVKPTGEITSRSVDLKPLWQNQNTSLADLATSIFSSQYPSSPRVKEIKVAPIAEPNYKQKLQNLQKLHQILIEPIAELLPNQPDERVIFIPHGDLFFVPFAALNNGQGEYLIEQHTIGTAPSIQVLSLLEQRQQQIQGVAKDILVVGNPTMPKMPSDLGGGRPFQLPGAEKEAKNIASIFNTQALVGDAATETAVVQRMPKARIIHIATIFCSNNQLKLALTASDKDDGWLTSKEIVNLNLQAELVVLSASHTATGKITGDGVNGLSRSFFTAGVPTVIGSLWNIQDYMTTFLMTEFYQNLSENPDKATALRHAMLTTMKKYPNPKDWAAFTLIGAL